MASLNEHFESVLRVAQWLSEEENSVNALLALARMVGREFAYEIMLNELVSETGLTPLTGWYDLADRYGVEQESASGERVWLEWDIVVTQPWSDGALAEALTKLSRGPAGEPEKWRSDPSNHQIGLWLPMRLAEVQGGNHSIAAGMLSNTGKVSAAYIVDLSPLYERLAQPQLWIDHNGQNFVYWKVDGGAGGVNVGDWRLGLLFEIGRLLHQHGFDGRIGDDWHP